MCVTLLTVPVLSYRSKYMFNFLNKVHVIKITMCYASLVPKTSWSVVEQRRD